MSKFNLVILSGAGISAESGLKTFRDSDGLWENYHIHDVATPQAWQKDPALVLQFYNERRKNALAASPNKGHITCAELEADFHVQIVTQNVDNLHERAGSANILHLHGQLMQARGQKDIETIVDLTEGEDIELGQLAPDGTQLRPHIVWFGEMVPMLPTAAELVQQADAMIVVGTSLQVYPAASLVDFLDDNAPLLVVDPAKPDYNFGRAVEYFQEGASTGMPKAEAWLRNWFLNVEG